MSYRELYSFWTEDAYFDEDTKKELLSISDEKEIKDRFYKDLDFGTGGLRGVIGAGTNRMNIYTIRKATQGLANYILKENGQDMGVAIAYDSRNMSIEFSEEAALCLNANGIKTYVFDSLRPTPELSFAVRKLGCIAGIVITASHNPPEYNGYKVYWKDGAQITAPKDKEIINEVKAVDNYADVKTMDKTSALNKGLYNSIGNEIDDAYILELKKLVLHPESIKQEAKEIKIVYTPLHGTGNVPVRRILKELGFENVYVVPKQELPDGNFSTVDYPNPEDPKAFTLALQLAKEKDADIVLATDPDADRLGVYAKDSNTGEYVSFTGNMSGLLIAEYILASKKEQGTLSSKAAMVKTIVSSNMAEPIAKGYDIKLIEVLTGFKYIGEQIKLFEENNTYEYIFGYEESYGCLLGTYARDKDAIVAVMALCEVAAYYKTKGLTLWDQMLNIYDKYGYYKENLASITLKGEEGSKKIQEILKEMRTTPLKQIGEFKVEAIRDYQSDKRLDLATSQEESTGLPKSNVLYYELENDAWCCVRPSGTEPKVKFYMGVKGSSLEDASEKLESLTNSMLGLVRE
ncbi:phospho-sugar mutase [Anaerosporobacter sp.]|uniref:phospho-sugar mutase n=1 Tax=Anaerosporobacter sp. TaxID=1872529 RepID=UPI00286EF273|nr:phospho-sugar mutase [Anaerosporobacter sp.]